MSEAVAPPIASPVFGRSPRADLYDSRGSLRRNVRLVAHLSWQKYRLRYRRSFFGGLWAPVLPLVRFAVFYIFFTKVIKIQVKDFPTFLFIGVVAWSWFSASVLSVTTAALSSREVLFQPGVANITAPIIATVVELIDLCVSIPIMLLLVQFSGPGLHFSALALPFLLLIEFFFILAVALPLSVVNVRLRDAKLFIEVALLIWMFLTPIFYQISFVPAKYHKMIEYNPMTRILSMQRSVLLGGKLPPFASTMKLSAIVVALFAGAVWLYSVSSRKFVDEL